MERVFLDRSRQRGAALVRELAGHDEEAVAGTGTEAAVALLDRLLVDGPEVSVRPGDAAGVATPDRDRLFAVIYRRAFGDRIETELACEGCGERFTMEFSLVELEASVLGAARPAPEDDWFRASGGRRFRLPTAADELAVSALPERERERALFVRLVEGSAGDDSDDDDAVLEEMEKVGPIVDVDFDPVCPVCARGHQVRFDLQSWLLGAIEAEAAQRTLEIHRLATSYGWTLGEILGLTRRQRRAFAALAEKQPAA
jgi:hypothetical protein